MRYIIFILILVGMMADSIPCFAQDKSANKYVGVKVCSVCHKTEKSGSQFGVWKKSKHAEAYTVLTTAKANEIAKTKGLKTPAAESPQCLQCHVITADAKIAEKSFDPKDGVQCETCHGAGSGYKSMTVMKDKGKSVAAGMTAYKDEAAIEQHCRTCHNEKSPTYKEFKFKEQWAKIKHSRPKKG